MGDKNEGITEIDCHISKKYEIRKRIGKGAYGIVWKAIDRKNGDIVAVKKIFDAFRNETDAQRTFREIVFLLEFSAHPNVIRLLNVLRADNNKDIYLVFQHMETDLHNVIKKGNVLEGIHRRYIMYQLFRATKYLHSGSVIHRDLKPSNILLDSDCRVKVADFGLARSVEPCARIEPQGDPALTNYVATRWYRAPEILLNSKRYTLGVDMWSLGCILGEMLLGKPMFPGSSTLDQIDRIMAVIKSPSREDLHQIPPQYASTLINRPASENAPKPLRELLADAPSDAVDLVEKLLLFNPDKRLTAEQALKHPYVSRFHNSANEPGLVEAVVPCIRDDIQLSVEVYRNKLYELIASKKNKLKSVTVDKTNNNNNNNVSKSSDSSHRGRSNSFGNSREADNGKVRQTRHSPNQSHSSSSSSSSQYNSHNYSHISQSQPIKVKVISKQLEKQSALNVQGMSRQTSKEDKSSAKSSGKSSKSSSSSSSPPTVGRRPSPHIITRSNVTPEKLKERKSSISELEGYPVQNANGLTVHSNGLHNNPIARSGGVTVTVGNHHSSISDKSTCSTRTIQRSMANTSNTISPSKVLNNYKQSTPMKTVTALTRKSTPNLFALSQHKASCGTSSNRRHSATFNSAVKFATSNYAARSFPTPSYSTKDVSPLFSQYATISSSAYRELQQGVK